MVTLATLQDAQKNKSTAQRLLFERYSGILYRLAFRYLQDQMEAEDVITEAFVRIFDKLPSMHFEAIPPFEAWIKRITINEALHVLRRSANFHLVSDSIAENISIDENIIHHLTAEEIMVLIGQLPVGYRTIFILYVIEGYTHPEIAQLVGISEGTSKSQLSKAKALLQKKLIDTDNSYEQRQLV